VLNPVAALTLVGRLAAKTIILVHNAHRFLTDVSVVQAVANLRDCFKGDHRTLVLLGPSVELPVELSGDVVQFDSPYPEEAELREIVGSQLRGAESQLAFTVTEQMIERAAESLRGTAPFAAEQLTALAIRKERFDSELLDTQARKVIEATEGLTFEVGDEKFADIGGLDFAKQFAGQYFSGPRRPAVVVRIEELEKAMTGTKGGDLSGASDDALQVLLSAMEDYNWSGMLAYGPPGCTKSLYAKAVANEFGAKGLRFDVNACKGSLQGESERKIRQAVKVIESLGGARVFFVASVNKLDTLPPELQRRFRAGVWFFDLPTDEERQDIWRINCDRYGIDLSEAAEADESDLTGADIRNICDMAAALQCTLAEARRYVVPLKTQSPADIAAARDRANGKYISAAYGGVYVKPELRQHESGRGSGRQVEVE
jgi:SpoVK/Ycf46/Vps4 family AAA+-type ATPase